MLIDQIKSDQIAAMKAQDALKLSVLRMVLSAANYKQIELQKDLTDADVQAVIAAEVKKRKEAIESYTKANSQDRADKEKQELDILMTYMPQQLSEDELRVEINKLDLPADFGQAMKLVSPMFKGRADGGQVASIVKEKLGNG